MQLITSSSTSKLTHTASARIIPNRYMFSLPAIMLLALVIRLLAAFFSKGYAFHDDHFDVISIAQDWVYGIPRWLNGELPPRHSMFYVGIHYALFSIMNSLGLTNPDTKMTIIRLLHGLYSLLVIYFGYRITERLSTKANASIVGLMLTLVWFMPFMSVRNLVEMVCIPPFLAGFYFMLKKPNSHTTRRFFIAGALFALAFVIRYHTILFAAGAGLVLLYNKQWREILWFSLGFIVVATAIQGTIDVIFFDYPFHSIVAYFLYNSENANNYSTGPIYRFALTILGFLVPPVSAFLMYGYARTRKVSPMLFFAGLLFFVAHSLFPNKQERFILPLFPLIMILGVIGWQDFVKQSCFWQNRLKLLKGCWTFFWVLNIIAALGMALTYSKKTRIAPLVYLSKKPDVNSILLEFGHHSIKMAPVFYLGRPAGNFNDYQYNPNNDWAKYKNGDVALPQNFMMVFSMNHENEVTEISSAIENTNFKPDYVVVVGQDDLEERMTRIHSLYPKLQLEKTIEPSLYDQILHKLNPRVHKYEQVRIYQIL